MSRCAASASAASSRGASRIVSSTSPITPVSGNDSRYSRYSAVVVTSSCPDDTASVKPRGRRVRSNAENTDPEWVTSPIGPVGSGSRSR